MSPNKLASSFPLGIELPKELKKLCEWNEVNGYPISGGFELRQHDDKTIQCWFGTAKPIGFLAQFGAGPDGSLYCIWKHNGDFLIVHMGSEGQNNFVLASNPVDFLRLLAIGYDEIGFADLSLPPENEDEINPSFQDWVSINFNVPIPKTGNEITGPLQGISDNFQSWIDSQTD